MRGLLEIMKVILTWFVKSAGDSPVEPPKKGMEPEVQVPPLPQILFKTPRINQEYKDLYEKNRHLQDIILECQMYAYHKWGKNITVTMIYRTDAEQAEIYKDDPKYKEKPFKSPHQFWQAFDLRSSTFDTTQINELVNMLNTVYNNTNGYKWTSVCHDVGKGEHLHVQYVRK